MTLLIYWLGASIALAARFSTMNEYLFVIVILLLNTGLPDLMRDLL